MVWYLDLPWLCFGVSWTVMDNYFGWRNENLRLDHIFSRFRERLVSGPWKPPTSGSSSTCRRGFISAALRARCTCPKQIYTYGSSGSCPSCTCPKPLLRVSLPNTVYANIASLNSACYAFMTEIPRTPIASTTLPRNRLINKISHGLEHSRRGCRRDTLGH